MAHSLSFLITGQIITISNLGKRRKKTINKENGFPWQPEPGETIFSIYDCFISVLSRAWVPINPYVAKWPFEDATRIAVILCGMTVDCSFWIRELWWAEVKDV